MFLTRKNSHNFFLCSGSRRGFEPPGLWISSPTLYPLSYPDTLYARLKTWSYPKLQSRTSFAVSRWLSNLRLSVAKTGLGLVCEGKCWDSYVFLLSSPPSPSHPLLDEDTLYSQRSVTVSCTCVQSVARMHYMSKRAKIY